MRGMYFPPREMLLGVALIYFLLAPTAWSIRAFLRSDGGLQFEQYSLAATRTPHADATGVTIMIAEPTTLQYKHGERQPACLWYTDHWPHPWHSRANQTVAIHVGDKLTLDGQRHMRHMVCHQSTPLPVNITVDGDLTLVNNHPSSLQFNNMTVTLRKNARVTNEPAAMWSHSSIRWELDMQSEDDVAYVDGIVIQTPTHAAAHHVAPGRGSIVWSPVPSRHFAEDNVHALRTAPLAQPLLDSPSIRLRAGSDVSGPCVSFNRWNRNTIRDTFAHVAAAERYPVFMSCARSWTLQALATPAIAVQNNRPELGRSAPPPTGPRVTGKMDEARWFPGLRVVHPRTFLVETPEDDAAYQSMAMETWDPLRDASIHQEYTHVRRNATLDARGWNVLTHVPTVVVDPQIRLVIDPDVVNPDAFRSSQSRAPATKAPSARSTVRFHLQDNAAVDIRGLFLADTRIEVVGPPSAVFHLVQCKTNKVEIQSSGGAHVFVENTHWMGGTIRGSALWLSANTIVDATLFIHPVLGELSNNRIIDTLFHVDPTAARGVATTTAGLDSAFMFDIGNNQMVQRNKEPNEIGFRLHPHLQMRGRTLHTEQTSRKSFDKTFINWDHGHSSASLTTPQKRKLGYAKRLALLANTTTTTTTTDNASVHGNSSWFVSSNNVNDCVDLLSWTDDSTSECPAHQIQPSFDQNLCPDLCSFARDFGCPVHTGDMETIFIYAMAGIVILGTFFVCCVLCFRKASQTA